MIGALRPLECGWLTTDFASLVAGQSGRVRIPVPVFLIEHPRGLVLFDSGLHPELATSDARLRSVADLFAVEISDAEVVSTRLRAIGIDPADIAVIVTSHLHFDHCGGHALIPDARVVVQQAEWEAAHDDGMIAFGAYNPDDFEVGHDVQLVDGDHDLFGDGSLQLVLTDGHTPGHQSLVVDDRLVLVGDACYCRLALETDRLPAFMADEARQRAGFAWLRAHEAAGRELIFSHDPDQWSSLPATL